MGPRTKSLFASKTFWFGAIYTVVTFAGLAGFGKYTPPADLVDAVQQLAGLVAIALRIVTKEPVTVLPS